MSDECRNFDLEVIEKSRTVPVLVDFWASWCAPCRALGPILESLAERSQGRWLLVKVNTEEQPEPAARYNIRSIPAVKLFVDGLVVDEFAGAMPEEMIAAWLRAALPDPHEGELLKARHYLKQDGTGEAREILEQVLRENPDNAGAAALLAVSWLPGDYRRAEDLVRGVGVGAGSEGFDLAEAVRILARLLSVLDGGLSLPDSPVRETYLSAIEVLGRGDYDSALQGFIDVIRKDRRYDGEGARKACVALFKVLGEDHELTRKHRPSFGAALHV